MKQYLLIKGLLIWLISTFGSSSYAGVADEYETLAKVNRESVINGLMPPITFKGEEQDTFSVTERLSYHNVPGISFALIHKGEIAWAQGFGRLAANSDEPVTKHTIFQAGSIAKPVTAYAVMRMFEREALDINIDIQRYLTSLTLPKGKQSASMPLTFKNLLDHSSGLTAGGYMGYQKGEMIPSDVQTFLGQKPASNKPVLVEQIPGTEIRYSGAGYTLVEIALSNIYGAAFENVMQKWVLSPVAMNASSFAMKYPELPSIKTAIGHDNHGKPIEGGWRVHPEQAAAGLWATPTDIANFALEVSRAYQGDSILLSRIYAREMLTPVTPNKDLSNQFGGQPAMTFVIDNEGQDFLFKHGGGTMGYRSFMVMHPETGNGAVFMANSDVGYSVGLEMLRAASFVYDWPGFKTRSLERGEVDAKKQQSFINAYQFEAGWKIDVVESLEADGIAVVFPNGDVYPLTAIRGENTYVHADTGVEVSFSTESDKPQIFIYNQVGNVKLN